MKELDDDQIASLGEHLEALLRGADFAAHRATDPVERVWSYASQPDQELAALVASSVAYGRVALVRDAGRRILEPLGPSPAETLADLSNDDLQEMYDGYVYRMTRGEDVVDLLHAVRELLARHGTLEEVYALGDGSPTDRASAFVRAVRAERLRPEMARGFGYLLPDPADGSTCKRLHLFFRWMGRGPDDVDLGLWDALDASDLMMPLDTHTSRICRYVGLCSRKSLDHRTVLEVTSNLARLDPDDPLRYDFAICHLGISGGCIHTYSEDHCPQCPLMSVCQIAAAG